MHRNVGRKGSKGALQKRLQEKALPERGVEEVWGRATGTRYAG